MMRICLSLLLAVAGCAARTSPAPETAVGAGSRATVVAVRAVTPSDGILTMIGSPSGIVQSGETKREFIVRTEAGRIISIVQEDAEGWHPGQAVSVIDGEHARLSAGL